MKKTVRVILMVMVVLMVAFVAAIRFKNRNLLVTSSNNMAPTIISKDTIEVDYDSFASRLPEKGEMVVFVSNDSSPVQLGRIVGLPGDLVSFQSGKLHVNDSPAQQTSESVEGVLDGEKLTMQQSVGALIILAGLIFLRSKPKVV